jgi:hypothetical protein
LNDTDDMCIYFIPDWDEKFEHKAKKTSTNPNGDSPKTLKWVSLPVDPMSYEDLRYDENGKPRKDAFNLIGVWMRIVLIAARSPKRGELLRANGTPYTLETLGRFEGIHTTILKNAIPRLIEINKLASKCRPIHSTEHCTETSDTTLDTNRTSDRTGQKTEQDIRQNRTPPPPKSSALSIDPDIFVV